MTQIDLQLEQHFRKAAQRPQRKFEETITTFDRDIFWYDRDEKLRQEEASIRNGTTKVTYEDHRKAVETAVNMMRKDTQHDIAMCILTHRFFANYRKNAFAGKGGFTHDYSFIIKKVAMLFDHTTERVTGGSYHSKLRDYTKPTLVQINHITGEVTPLTPPSNKFTLQDWAAKYSANAVESTSYQVAGLKIG